MYLQVRRPHRFIFMIPLFVACTAPHLPATGATESTASSTSATETDGPIDLPTDPTLSSLTTSTTSTSLTTTTTTDGSTGMGADVPGDLFFKPFGGTADRCLREPVSEARR